jgi:hypothetical protein
MLLQEQNQTTAINVTGNSTREFIIMSLGVVAVIPRNDLQRKSLVVARLPPGAGCNSCVKCGWLAMQQDAPVPHLWVTGQVPQHARLKLRLARIHDGISTRVTNFGD